MWGDASALDTGAVDRFYDCTVEQVRPGWPFLVHDTWGHRATLYLSVELDKIKRIKPTCHEGLDRGNLSSLSWLQYAAEEVQPLSLRKVCLLHDQRKHWNGAMMVRATLAWRGL